MLHFKVECALKQIDNNGAFSYHGSVEVKIESAQEFALSQNYPNPFNPTTMISFAVPKAGKATLKVYDLLGQEVATLVDGMMSAGSHEATFNASKLSSGTYIYRLNAENFVETRKMVLLR